MAAPSVTYTFTNGTTADATQVNQNFTDVLNGVSDGTKDLSLNALTLAGTLNANGNINLGNASGDDLTILASLASSLAIKTDASYDIGSTTKGLRKTYFGGNSHRVSLAASGSTSADWDLTLPVSAGSAGQTLRTNGAGIASWATKLSSVKAHSGGDYTILDTDGYDAIFVTTSTSNRAITLPAAANNTGREITIAKVDSASGQVTITGTVEGVTTCQLGFQYCTLTVVSDGTSWFFKNGFYSSSSQAMTFTWNGSGGNTGAINIPVYRRGNIVTVRLIGSVIRATTGTSSTALSASTALPTWAAPPATLEIQGSQVRNNGSADVTNVGLVEVTSANAISIYRNIAGGTFTNAAVGGLQADFCVAYSVV